MLHLWFPAPKGWIVSSQQPPTGGDFDLRRVDATVQIIANDQMQTLLMYEAKRYNSTRQMIVEVEMQAFQACQSYLANSGRDSMYAITTVGTGIRFWTVTISHIT
jgi:hypothetical protein